MDVENVSGCDGVEVVRLYINDAVPEVIRPTKEWKAFKRIEIQARGQETVECTLTEKDLRYYHGNEGKADKGQFGIFVGKDSSTTHKIPFDYQET